MIVTAVEEPHQNFLSPMPDGAGDRTASPRPDGPAGSPPRGTPDPGPPGAHDACPGHPPGHSGHTVRSVLRRLRTPHRPRFWFEVVLVVASYWIYSLIRSAVPEQRGQALHNADWVWMAEQHLGIAVEGVVNRALNTETWLIVGMNYYYATLHFIVTMAVLTWLYRRHPGRYSASRLVLLVTTASALVGYYVYPLAPPRLVNHSFIDTLIVHRTWGSLASGSLKDVSNQYAAMPSMHVGWSLWCGLTIFSLSKVPWARVLGLLYPAATMVVIVATANHFWLDGVGGIICLACGYAVARWWYGSLPYSLPRLVPTPRVPRAMAMATAPPGASDSRVTARSRAAHGRAAPARRAANRSTDRPRSGD
jgi:hypothetical protein